MQRVAHAILSLSVLALWGCYEGGERRLVAGDSFAEFGSESVDTSAGVLYLSDKFDDMGTARANFFPVFNFYSCDRCDR